MNPPGLTRARAAVATVTLILGGVFAGVVGAADVSSTLFVHTSDSIYSDYLPSNISDDATGLSHSWHSGDQRTGDDFPHWVAIDFDVSVVAIDTLRLLAYADPTGVRLRRFRFEGSLDGATFYPLHDDTLMYANSHTWQSFALDDEYPYRFYRLTGYDNWTTDPLSKTQMIVEEWELNGRVEPVIDVTSTIFEHTASSVFPYGGDYQPANVSDNLTGLPHSWHSGDDRTGYDFPHWVQIDFGSSHFAVDTLRLLAYEDETGVRLRHFLFQGSNDGVMFYPLHEDTLTYENAHEWQTFGSLNTNHQPYRYYRVTGLDNWCADSLTRTQMIIEEWEMTSPLMTAVGDGGGTPKIALHQNFPNPFNPRTTISFTLPASGHVALTILDARGREVARLLDETVGAGTHSIDWTGVDNAGRSLPSGTYFCRLEKAAGVETRKLALIR